jgi:hypothetical protein
MIRHQLLKAVVLLAALSAGLSTALAAPKKVAPEIQLTESGEQLEAGYAARLSSLQAEITNALPGIPGQKEAVLQQARDAVKRAAAKVDAAQQALGKIQGAKGLVDHARGKWIGGADQGIAQAQVALKQATTDAGREAARQDLAKWQANKQDGLKALEEREAAYAKAKADEPRLKQDCQAAQAALTQARANELSAAEALLAEVEQFLSDDKLDAKLVRCVVLAEATPRGLAEFAQQDEEKASLVEKLLADDPSMREMLIAGGARSGKYGQAMDIYAAIQQASPRAGEGLFQRLALATSLEHAVPVRQSNAKDSSNAPSIVDPVKRYLHYEKAYLEGELDPAFKDFSAWEYRLVVGCDAPDAILAWGRAMLRTYRPDHLSNPDYGWRYSAAVRTDVRYGSQGVKDDLPSLHDYQNIPRNGGVCGRRAFFGRFILRSFGIPTWGVTQHAHAALSHWTPSGWVVNLGAGFHASWWDKDDAPRSGSDFLLETQAREHGQDYLKVLRAKWVSRALGEPAYNDRKKVDGGFWSRLGHDQAMVLAAHAVELGPLGQELAEATEAEEKQDAEQVPLEASDPPVLASRDGSITIPAVPHGRFSGPCVAMKSFSGGTQIHAGGGFKNRYQFDAPRAGKHTLTARVATLQVGQTFFFKANDAGQSVEIPVPYTIGLWQQTKPVEITLVGGRNVLDFEIQQGSRGVTIKEFTLTPAK